jgi:hypothetical protein
MTNKPRTSVIRTTIKYLQCFFVLLCQTFDGSQIKECAADQRAIFFGTAISQPILAKDLKGRAFSLRASSKAARLMQIVSTPTDASDFTILIDNYPKRDFPVQNEACLLSEYLAGIRLAARHRYTTFVSAGLQWPQVEQLAFPSRRILFINDLAGLERAASRECQRRGLFGESLIPSKDTSLAALFHLSDLRRPTNVVIISYAIGRFDLEGRATTDESYWLSGEYETQREAVRDARIFLADLLQYHVLLVHQDNMLAPWPLPGRKIFNSSIHPLSGGAFRNVPVANGNALSSFLADRIGHESIVGCVESACGQPKRFRRQKSKLSLLDRSMEFSERQIDCHDKASEVRSPAQPRHSINAKDRLELFTEKLVLTLSPAPQALDSNNRSLSDGQLHISVSRNQLAAIGLSNLSKVEYLAVQSQSQNNTARQLVRRDPIKIIGGTDGGYVLTINKPQEHMRLMILLESSDGRAALSELSVHDSK